jgi:3-oxoacyl-[acyl-carrier protein] reductase
MDLEGRVALVTGASRGIGRAIAETLAAKGAAVAVNYRTGERDAEEVVDAIRAHGGTAFAVHGDVAAHQDATSLVERTIAELGGLHILVNNAGITKDGLIYNMEPGDWLEVMRVNLGGVVNCTRAAMGHLMAERAGVIVNISSGMAERAWVGDAAYSASKAAIGAFTRSSALELARFGVRVNAVMPGFIPTQLVSGLLEKDAGEGIKRQIPLREFGTPNDVAGLVAFLAGPEAAYITGSLVTVDGGVSSLLGVGAPL